MIKKFLFVTSIVAFLYVDVSAQNVGIGESAPSKKLEIKSSVGGDGLKLSMPNPSLFFIDNTSANKAWSIYNQGSDNGLAIRSSADDFSTSLNTRLFINHTTGNVGVGNTSPTYKLDVTGAIVYNDAGFDQYSLTVSNTNFQELTFGGNSLPTSKVYRVVLSTLSTGTNTGYVAIVWYNSDVSAWYVRHVSRSGTSSNHPYLFVDANVVKVRTDHANNYPIAISIQAFASDDDDDPNIFGSDYMWQRVGSELNFPDGNVGIGVANPSYKLDVSGTGRFTGQVSIPLLPTANEHAASKKYVDDQIGAITETDPTWSGSANTSSTIGRTGSVGIGTTSPGASLEVRSEILINNTSTRGNAFLEINRGSDGKDRGMIVYSNASNIDWYAGIPYNCGGNTDQYVISSQGYLNDCSVTHTPEFVLTSSGNVGIGVTNPSYKLHVNGKLRTNGINETSDGRLKRNVNVIENALAKVIAMRGVNYEWRVEEYPDKDFSKGVELGVIAQEIEKVLPEVVSTDFEGFKSVQYSHIVPVLIEAIKEQQNQINLLTAENKSLNTKLNFHQEMYMKLDLDKLLNDYGSSDYSSKK